MNILRKAFAATLAASLIHVSLEPASAAISRAASRETGAPVKLRLGPSLQPVKGWELPSGWRNSPGMVSAAKDPLTRPFLPITAVKPTEAAKPTPQARTAKAMLQAMGDQASAAAQGDPAASEALRRPYTGERALKGGESEPIPAAALGGRDSGLKPSGSRASQKAFRRSTPSPRANPQSGRVNVVLLIVAGAILAVAAVVFFIWRHGQKQNELWEASKSNQAIVAIETARRSGDAEALERLTQESRGRRAQWREHIADAKSRGLKTVNNEAEDSLEMAEFYEAGDGLAGGRGELNFNVVSKDPRKRIGEELPAAWRESISRLEAQAKASGFEGSLALALKNLSEELSRQKGHSSRLEGDIKNFEEHVPAMFGGRLKEMSERARADLGEFKGSEISPEQALYEGALLAMRTRIAERLYRQSQEFRAHSDRLGRLAALGEGQLKSAADLARAIDNDLREMAEQRRLEAYHLLEASKKENVEVRKPVYDRHGNPVYDSKGNRVYRKVYEDQSRQDKELAASHAVRAQAAAQSAKRGLEILTGMIASLHRDPVIGEEGLRVALPSGTNHTRVDPGPGIFFDFWAPATWSFFATMFSESQASEARARFGAVVEALGRVEAEVKARQAAEEAWVSGAITRELGSQMGEASRKAEKD